MKRLICIPFLFFAAPIFGQLIPVCSVSLERDQLNTANNSAIILFSKPDIYEAGTDYNAPTGIFTATTTGFYKIESSLFLSQGTANTAYLVGIKKGGSNIRKIAQTFAHNNFRSISLNTDLNLNAGESISIVLFTFGDATTVNAGSYFNISRYR